MSNQTFLKLQPGQKWFVKLNPRSNKLTQVTVKEIRGDLVALSTGNAGLTIFGIDVESAPDWYKIDDIKFIQRDDKV